jgi:hypothetical protein
MACRVKKMKEHPMDFYSEENVKQLSTLDPYFNQIHSVIGMADAR